MTDELQPIISIIHRDINSVDSAQGVQSLQSLQSATNKKYKIRSHVTNKQVLNSINKYSLTFQSVALPVCQDINVDEALLASPDGILPKIPQVFKHLIENIPKITPDLKMESCDCGSTCCPHEQNHELMELIESYKLRVAHLNQLNPPYKQDIFNTLYEKVSNRLVCQKTMQDPDLVVTRHDCHVDRYCRELLNIKEEAKAQNIERLQCLAKFQQVIINLSFASNIFLLIIKIVAFALTNSLILLASAMDSSCDVLSGVILYILIKISQRGVQHGQYQRVIQELEPIQFMYCQRYESLGVLCFSCIMATLSVVIVASSVSEIIAVSKGTSELLMVDIWSLIILGVTIGVKLILYIMCFISNKLQQKDSIQAYQDDHRNDVISNIFGIIGIGLLTLNDSEPLMGLIDPIFCICICVYIIWNWIGTAADQMKSLVGKSIDQDQADEFMLRLLYQFVCVNKINSIKNIIGYSSGSKAVVELYIVLCNDLDLEQAHEIVTDIQCEFEQLHSVERCYVHIETPCSHYGSPKI